MHHATHFFEDIVSASACKNVVSTGVGIREALEENGQTKNEQTVGEMRGGRDGRAGFSGMDKRREGRSSACASSVKKKSKKRKKTPASLERGQYQQVRTAPTRILKADHYVSDSLTPFNSTLEPLHLAS